MTCTIEITQRMLDAAVGELGRIAKENNYTLRLNAISHEKLHDALKRVYSAMYQQSSELDPFFVSEGWD